MRRVAPSLGFVAFLASSTQGCSGGGNAALAATPAPLPVASASGSAETLAWVPSPLDTFQWQLAGIDTTVNASVYDVDAFETPSGTVATLHAAGRAGTFPATVIGRPYVGYPQSRGSISGASTC